MSSADFRRSLIAQVEQTVQGFTLPAVTLAYVPEPRREQTGEVEFGVIGLADGSAGLYYAWLGETRAQAHRDAARLDDLLRAAGFAPAGGTPLFRLYATPDAHQAQDHLARAHIWSRIFPYSQSWIRLGLPGNEAEWARMAALAQG